MRRIVLGAAPITLACAAGYDGVPAWPPRPRGRRIGRLPGRIPDWRAIRRTSAGSSAKSRLWKIKEPLELIAMTPDGRGLAGAGRKGDVYLFDLRGRKQTKTFPGYPGRPHCALMLDGAKYLALGGFKEGVQIFETRTGKLAHKFLPCDPPSVYHLSASSDAPLLLTYGQDRTVRIWKTPFGAAAA